MAELRQLIEHAFAGRLTVERELGRGGMSRVFLATARDVHRQVVVKVLPPELAAGINAERFRREIEVSGQLQHPHIVPLLDVGHDTPLLCFTMPYIEGESLRARMDRDGPLPVADAVRLWREIVDALSHAHARGVVHRDIKPENVLLSGKHAVVTDFGVAKAVREASHNRERVTSTGVSIGTPAYMAPEQAAAEAHIDHRADLYSATIVMWEMVAGSHPYAGLTSWELLAAQVNQRPPLLSDMRPDVPRELAELVNRCLAKNPDERPWSGDAVIAALDEVRGSGSVRWPARRSRWWRWRRWMLGVAALIGLAALVSSML